MGSERGGRGKRILGWVWDLLLLFLFGGYSTTTGVCFFSFFFLSCCSLESDIVGSGLDRTGLFSSFFLFFYFPIQGSRKCRVFFWSEKRMGKIKLKGEFGSVLFLFFYILK